MKPKHFIARKHERPVKKVRAGTPSGRHIAPNLAAYIGNRDGGICVYCQAEAGCEFDHVLPVSRGGKTIKGNLVLACRGCNGKKSNRMCEVLIARAFKHLLDVGESLDWVDTA